ncbi:MAG: HYR domain-containing protein [Verrucomicrobia bacterium]|nr:HYR domain-containing protein [Verrucomicrobiota bacterium]
MKLKPLFPRSLNARLLSRMRAFLCLSAGPGRLLAGAVLGLVLHAGPTALAQSTTNVVFTNDCLTVICPGDRTVFICSDVVTPQSYPVLVSNNCPNVPFQVVCQPPPGTPLPVGSNPITCTVFVGGAVFAQCGFTITVVRDTLPPQMACPSNMVEKACPDAAGGCGATVNYPAPLATDNSGVVSVVCVPPSGSYFPCGATTVACTATDRCNNKTSCEFTVTVTEGGHPPIIECPADITVTTCSNGAVVAYPLPIVNPATALVTCVPPPGSFFPLGASAVTCVASNECGSAQCSFKVIVRSVPPVSIQCPTNELFATVPCGSNCVPVFYPIPTVANGALIGCQPPSGACLPVGDHFVICRATNECGQVAGCEFVVHVQPGQGEPPIIRCPQDILVSTCSNCAPVNYTAPVVLNGALAGCNPPSGFCFPLGVTTVTCLATNPCGSAECKFTVTVRPVPPVSIQCPTNELFATVPCGSNCVPVFYPVPTVSNGALVGCQPPSGACLPVGDHFVICRATNECGQVAGCEFAVHVQEGQGHPPVINCPSNITVRTCKDCEVVVYPAAVVVNGTLLGCTPPSGSCFPLGVTTVTCVATNPCGAAECSFTITVRPVPPVEIICPSDIVVTTCSSNEVVVYPPPVVTPAPSTLPVLCTPPSGSAFPLGTNVVRCCVIDPCEQVHCCSFEVVVRPGNPCVKPPAHMVLWLPFDEPLGPIAHNIVPGAPNGLHVNGPVPFLGQKVLNSLAFDGGNDFVMVPNYAAIQLSMTDLTIDAWILRRDTAANAGRRVIVSKLGKQLFAVGPRGYEFYLNNGVMNLFLGGVLAQNFNSGVLVPLDNNWHHVAVTVRRSLAGTVTFYLDGLPVNAQPGPITAPLANNARLYVGAGTWPAPNSFFRGGIDEVEIFNRALPPAQIFSLWRADKAGKCKLKCVIPTWVSIPPGVNCVTVQAQFCNQTPFPTPAVWTANGALPITPPNGTVVIPPFGCVTVPVTLCRPTNFPAGAIVPWTMTLQPAEGCPIVCTGHVFNRGPIVVVGPDLPVGIVGTNRAGSVRLGLEGLPPGVVLRLRAIGPDMEPDMGTISLNGLPPGEAWLMAGAALSAKDATGFDVSVRFADHDPIGLYTILLEADLDGDGEFEPLASFDVENPVVPPPQLQIVAGPSGLVFDWSDDGTGHLEAADSLDGPWTPIEGSRPGHPFDPKGAMKFYRVSTPDE